MAENLKKRPSKSILKNSSSFDIHDSTQQPSKKKNNKGNAKWDEMNIMATLHPADKDYGFMKIDEPKTPYNYEGLDVDPDSVDANELAKRLQEAGSATPKVQQGSSMDEDDDDDLTPEQRAAKKEFEMKRKKHYNEYYAVKLAKKLLEQEEEDDDDDDDASRQQSTTTTTAVTTTKKNKSNKSAFLSNPQNLHDKLPAIEGRTAKEEEAEDGGKKKFAGNCFCLGPKM